MKPTATKANVDSVVKQIESFGCEAHLSEGKERTIIGIVGRRPISQDRIITMDGVDKTLAVTRPFKLVNREFQPESTKFPIGNHMIGDEQLFLIAGPGAAESREQMLETAYAIKEAGAQALSAGAFLSRTSPYAFQGNGKDGLSWLAEAKEVTGLPILTQVSEPENVAVAKEFVDMLMVSSSNMQNFALLQEIGRSQLPVLLKRNHSSSIEEWLMSAEYLLSHGNNRVILCERGIRTFEQYTANTFDINAIAVAKQMSHLPVFADPSTGTGRWEYVTAIARASIAAGADGLFFHVHTNPSEAWANGRQSLKPEKYAQLVKDIRGVAQAVGRLVPEITG